MKAGEAAKRAAYKRQQAAMVERHDHMTERMEAKVAETTGDEREWWVDMLDEHNRRTT